MGRPRKEKPNRKDGLYEVKITLGKDFSGTPVRKSFYSSTSKADARKKAEKYKMEMEVSTRTGEVFVGRDITFGEWAVKWLVTYKKGNVKEHTYNFTYRVNVEKYLIPYFGHADIKHIHQVDIQNYFREAKNLSKSTLLKHKMILRDIYTKAIYNDLCVKNPVMDIKMPHFEEKERCVWNKAQAQRAYQYSKDHPDGVSVVVFLATGIRRSELIGLKWSDIDFEKKYIHVQRAVVPTTKKIVEGGTKSKKSNRMIPVSKDFINYLKTIKTDATYILHDTNINKYANPNNFATRFRTYMKNMCNELDLPALTPHELRHTYGTVQREKGVDIYTIQKLMGHSDISITAKIYVHNDIDVLRNSMKFEDE